MTLRPWHSFVGLGIALLLGLSGVTCLSVIVLERDYAGQHAVNRATMEENIRLALWRLDSELAPLIANESTRPHLDWSQLPAQAFAERPVYVKLHFQFDEQGMLTSPQDRRQATELGARGDELSQLLDRQRELSWREGLASELALNASNPQFQGNESYSTPVQQFKGTVEWGARKRMSSQAADYNAGSRRNIGLEDGFFGVDSLAKPSDAAMLPLWIGDHLVLVRRVTVGGKRYLQGAWLDWNALRTKLLHDVRDLLPNASLSEVRDLTPDMRRVLATLPARLSPGDVPLMPVAPSGEVILVLVMAWFGVILAAVAMGGLLIGAVSLSERRGAFVSAVTHELRTPLTTFRMYTEMLSEGIIQDEAKKKKYLDTLRKEAIRLGHLVENVLSFARIERGRARAAPETILVQDLIARFEERLRDRATQADMTLSVEIPPEPSAVPIHVDTSAVEQILFNLVDNACKYAASATDRTIHVRAEGKGKRVEISVVDHGPGISGDTRRSLFSPFSKSAHQAANSAPGVGLGLALSRRLARSMGGELRYDDDSAGARFVLVLVVSR